MVTVAKSFEAPIKCEYLIYPSSLSPEQKAVGDWLSQITQISHAALEQHDQFNLRASNKLIMTELLAVLYKVLCA